MTSEAETGPHGRVSAVHANAFALAATVVLFLPLVVFVERTEWYVMDGPFGMVRWATVTLVGVVVHEALHGVGFRRAGVPWSEIRFGIKWRYLMPYAGSGRAMPVEGYRFAVALPGWVTGVLPLVWGVGARDLEVSLAAVVLLGAAGGDFLVWWKTRAVPGGAWVEDLPDEVGFRVVEPRPTSGA